MSAFARARLLRERFSHSRGSSGGTRSFALIDHLAFPQGREDHKGIAVPVAIDIIRGNDSDVDGPCPAQCRQLPWTCTFAAPALCIRISSHSLARLSQSRNGRSRAPLFGDVFPRRIGRRVAHGVRAQHPAVPHGARAKQPDPRHKRHGAVGAPRQMMPFRPRERVTKARRRKELAANGSRDTVLDAGPRVGLHMGNRGPQLAGKDRPQ